MPRNLIPNQFDYSGIYVEGQRSVFRFNKGYQGSFLSGMLVPMGDPIRVFPGVKLGLKIDLNVISNTMVAVPLNGIYIDVFGVWVPDRIVWTHQPQFLGENDTTAWTQSNSYSYPSIKYFDVCKFLYTSTASTYADDRSVTLGNAFLAPHYGLFDSNVAANSSLPAASVDINVLPFRGYYAIWNHLFRDENYQRPVLFSKGDIGSTGEFGYYLRDVYSSNSFNIRGAWNSEHGASDGIGDGTSYTYAILMPVNKLHDARTSVLPEPQFGNSVGLGAGNLVPVTTSTSDFDVSGMTAMHLADVSSGTVLTTSRPVQNGTNGTSVGNTDNTLVHSAYVAPSNLQVNLANALGTINQFRANVMTQRFIEALARSGRRVPEFYEAIYSVKNSKAMYDYPELVSHERYVCGVQQVVATADSGGSGWTSHLGDRGAYSLTVLRNVPLCDKEFTEFGYLHVLFCIRSTNQYSQIIPEHFTRKLLLDEYNPYFDHIGEVSMPNYLVNTSAGSANNFGFQEAWWSERTQENLCTGALNKAYGSLAYHTLGEVFDSSLITCTPGFLTFDPAVFDDVFTSSYWAYPQFLMDANIHGKKVARMSQHSIPGIVGRI